MPMRGVCAVLAVLPALAASLAGAEISFEDATAAAGIDRVIMTYGASWGDLDGDRRPDLWVGNHFASPSLYRNAGDGSFEDVAPEVWPGPRRDNHGAAWADFDRDGDQDLVELSGGVDANFLWVNEAGQFVDRAEAWGISFPGMRSRTPLWLDWNRDGILDLLLAHELGNGDFPRVLRGTRTGFVPATLEVGVTRASTSFVILADLDGDGEADLVDQGPRFPYAVYDMSTLPFTDRRDQLALSAHGDDWGVDAVVADLTGDGHNDLFFPKQGANFQLVVRDALRFDAKLVGNLSAREIRFATNARIQLSVFPEFAIETHELLRVGASGSGSFGPVLLFEPGDPAVAGLSADPGLGETALLVGFDPPSGTWTLRYFAPRGRVLALTVESDGPIEGVTTTGWDPDPLPLWPNYYVSTPEGFEERRAQSGFAMGVPCNSVVAGDFDNDMDLDLFLACSRPVANAPNMLFENQGDGSFVQVPEAGGAAGTDLGRSDSVAMADYDADGFLDLFVSNGVGGAPFFFGPHQLFRNLGNANHWLEIDLVGCSSNPEGIGAVVTLETAGIAQRRLQDGGMHSRSQNHSRLHFGLGSHDQIDRLEIRWPSGSLDLLRNLAADRVIVLAEGGGTSCAPRVPSFSNPGPALVGLVGLLALTGCIAIAIRYAYLVGEQGLSR